MKAGGSPPLWTWPAALLLAAAGVATCWGVGKQYGPVFDFHFLNLGRLEASRSQQPLVVVIGSSKTFCAIEPDELMSERLTEAGTPARVVRITKGGATLRDYSGLFELLLRVRPSLVVVESELATLEPNAFRERRAARYTGWREQSRHGFAALLAPNVVQRHGRENWDSRPARCGVRLDANVVQHRKDLLEGRRASIPEEREPLVAATKELKRVGVPVALLDFPIRMDEIGRKPQAIQNGERHAMHQLMATGLFYRFGDPPNLDPTAFADAGHLNPKGQTRTSAWLSARLSEMLRVRGP